MPSSDSSDTPSSERDTPPPDRPSARRLVGSTSTGSYVKSDIGRSRSPPVLRPFRNLPEAAAASAMPSETAVGTEHVLVGDLDRCNTDMPAVGERLSVRRCKNPPEAAAAAAMPSATAAGADNVSMTWHCVSVMLPLSIGLGDLFLVFGSFMSLLLDFASLLCVDIDRDRRVVADMCPRLAAEVVGRRVLVVDPTVVDPTGNARQLLLKTYVWKNDGRLEGCSERGDVGRRVQDCSCGAAQVPDEDWPSAFCAASVCAASLRTGECDLDLVRAKTGRLSESESGFLWLTLLARCLECFDLFSCSASTSAFSVSVL